MVIGVTISIKDNVSPKLNKLQRQSLKTQIGKKLLETAQFIQQRAIQYAYSPAPYAKTGNLASSIRIKRVDVNAGTAEVKALGNVAKRAHYTSYIRPVEYGARPHPIPNAFGIPGLTVQHPGMKGKFFMTRAAIDAQFIAGQKISEGIKLGIKDSGLKTK